MFELNWEDVVVGNTVIAGEYTGQVKNITESTIEIYWFELAANRSYTQEQAEANGFTYAV